MQHIEKNDQRKMEKSITVGGHRRREVVIRFHILYN